MKQKDITLIIVVAFVSGVFSILVSNVFISSPKSRKTLVEVVDPISSEFNQPDKKIFNKDAVDPTQNIQIGENPNPQPFNNP